MLETGMDQEMGLTGLSADQAVQLTRELCARLAEEGTEFHGNIWPGSVSISEDGHALLGEGSDAPVSGRSAGQVEYLAPEFFWDGEGSGASDVYSLGLMLYAGCNQGYLPFQPKGGALTDKDRSGALRKRMKGEEIVLPAGMSAELGAVVKKALAYEPEDRYASPAELLAALGATDEALPAGEPAAAAAADEFDWDAEPAAAAAADEFDWSAEPAARETADVTAEAEEYAVPDESVTVEDELDWTMAEEPEAPVSGEETDAPRYTVQKDFENTRSRRTSAVPATRTKKKLSPAIPILCVAAAAVIGGGVWYALNQKAPTTSPTLDLDNTVISEPVVLTAESPDPETTEPPAPEEDVHTVQMLDLEEGEDGEEPLEEGEDAEETAEAVTGSATVDGMDVTPASDTVYVTGTGVNLRTGPGTSYDVSMTLSKGAKLQRTGTVNGWSQVQYEGEEYYVSSSLVSVDEGGETESLSNDTGSGSGAGSTSTSTSTSSGDGTRTGGTGTSTGSSSGTGSSSAVTSTRDVVKVTGAEVNLRTGPGTNYSVSTTVKSGTELQRTGTTGSWSRVEYQGKELYISNSMIGTVSSDAVSAAVGTLKVTSDVNVRSGPDTNHEILGISRVGETLSITGIVDGKWYRVSYDGKEGYVNRKLISVQDFALITEQSGKVEITSKANIRSGPSTSYSILGEADVGTTLTVTGYTDSNWYQVSYNGETGYVAGNLVKDA